MANLANETILILHGWCGNKPEHWQEHLHPGLTEAGATVVYPKMPDPTAPDKTTWRTKIGETWVQNWCLKKADLPPQPRPES